MDEQLKQLVFQVRQCSCKSEERQQALAKLVDQMLRPRQICRQFNGQALSEVYFDILLALKQQLSHDVDQSIDRYSPGSVAVIDWVSRLRDTTCQKVLDELLQEATSLGFAKTASAQELPLSQLCSLDDLSEYLNQLKPLQSSKELVNLSQWLCHIFDAGWETVEAVFAPPPQLALGFRQPSSARPPATAGSIKRGKRLALAPQSDKQLALCMEITPTESSQMDICCEVYPADGQHNLPQNLQVMVLDQMDVAVSQAQARNTETIQLKFRGGPGEGFSIKIVLGDVSITEAFVI